MGCIVNGIGEASQANVGIFIPGSSEDPVIPVYVDGKPYENLGGETVFEDFAEILENYLTQKYLK